MCIFVQFTLSLLLFTKNENESCCKSEKERKSGGLNIFLLYLKQKMEFNNSYLNMSQYLF
jgi:hypothetical protein